MATHPSVHTWRNPWTEEPGGLQSIAPPLHTHTHTHTELEQMECRSVHAWRIPWTEEPGGLHAVHGDEHTHTHTCSKLGKEMECSSLKELWCETA